MRLEVQISIIAEALNDPASVGKLCNNMLVSYIWVSILHTLQTKGARVYI